MAIAAYVSRKQSDFDKDPRSGVFWRKAEKEIGSVKNLRI
jgi:hypothetical protein